MSALGVGRFGGLRLDAEPLELGFDGAVVCSDIEFDRGGAIAPRPGFDLSGTGFFSAYAADKWLTGMGYVPREYSGGLASPATVNGLIVVATREAATTNKLYAYSGSLPALTLNEASGAGVVRTAGSQLDLVSCGYATPSALHIVCGSSSFSSGDVLRAYKLGTGWVVLNASVFGWTALTAWGAAGNRLVACYGTRVMFSDPGDPTTWGANNYVDIGPGDGDQIRCGFELGETIMILKGRRGALFYGQSTKSDGSPEFQWREIEVPSPPVGSSSWCRSPYGVLVMCEDGIYLADQGGLHRWAPGDQLLGLYGRFARMGGEDQQGRFEDGSLAYGPSLGARIAWASGRLHLMGGPVWDDRAQAWSLWGRDFYSSTGFTLAPVAEGWSGDLIGYTHGGSTNPYAKVTLINHVGSLAVDKAGGYSDAAVTGRYVSGLSDFGSVAGKRGRALEVMARIAVNQVSGQVNAGWRNESGLNAALLDATLGQSVAYDGGYDARRLVFRAAASGRRLGFELALRKAQVAGLRAEVEAASW